MSSDFHTHTRCSPDSSTAADRVIEAAVKRGLTALAITDHAEIDPAGFGFVSPSCRTYSKYREIVSSAAASFEGKIKTLMGVEVGYRTEFEEEIREFLGRHEFDIVIGSVHDSPPVDWWDPEARIVLAKRPELGTQALIWYFTELERAASSGMFDVIAHIDIYERYMPGLWPNVLEEPSIAPLAEKAVAAIAKHSRMEINMAMYNRKGEFAWSALPFLRMYKEMGGKEPTVGSDAHTPDWVGLNVEVGESLARKAGFSKVATWEDIMSSRT